MNGIRWTLRVTATEPDVSRVSVRRQQFPVGRPIEFDVDAPRVAALEYVLGAVGAEIVGGLRMFAKRRRIELDQIEAIVNGELENPLVFLEVIGEAGGPRIARLHVKVFVTTAADEQTLRRLWDETLERLPLVCTLRGAVDLVTELAIAA